MIHHLTLKDVGPARDLKFAFPPRSTVLTGDNGLGKTFVLDVLWWVQTTTWAGEKASSVQTSAARLRPSLAATVASIRAHLDVR